ncbi:MAG: succinate dehydrogenase assembly factor 2 [Succinivibrionaceae bacterium]|nr:succinate dehydrogenase assembly factor 2 [Ruminobacter sp.]MDY5779630.1 succinate dehydrogenase assembly factor 2 [Succinivibrionaceae bacterium]MEE1339187.1 succinate dehydrogenase assembly factor 2 [Succinivibrionaceae bacterium]
MITEQNWDSLKWKSRRGMREIDLMLDPFVKNHLPQMSEEVFWEYNEFLDLSDLDLVRFLLRRQTPTLPLHVKIVNLILKCHQEDLEKGIIPDGI